MRSHFSRRPSPALIVAFLALLVALGGTAIGLPGKNRIDKNDLKKRVVRAINVQKNAIRQYQIDLGAVGQTQLKDEVVAARAYAYVDSNATVRTDAPSFGITNGNLSTPATGRYCVDGLPFTPRHVQATADSFGDNDNIITVLTGRDDSCPGTEQATIENYDISAAGLSNEGFFLVIY
jgi:hypothetical protein